MSSKEQTTGKESSRRQQPQATVPNAKTLTPQLTDLAAVVQRARLDPEALTPRDVLQLQRVIGNQAVNRILAGAGQSQPVQSSEDAAGGPDTPKAAIQTACGMSTCDAHPATSIQPQTGRPILQRLKRHAEKYAAANKLPLTVDRKSVVTYVNNTGNDKTTRRELLREWNRGQRNSRLAIPMPEDLRPAKVEMKDLEDFSGWNSEDEDEMDIPKVINRKRKASVTLVRGDGREIQNVPVLAMPDVIRLGRQIQRRDEYERFLPLVAQIGPLHIEYDNPGTKDIYATPLTPLEKSGKFKRAGTSHEYNFANLTSRLEGEAKEPGQKKQKLEGIFGAFSGKSPGQTSEAEAETIGAISCDFMKGSSAIEFVKEAQEHATKAVSSFSAFFTAGKPLYRPAATGGRGLIAERARKRREARLRRK